MHYFPFSLDFLCFCFNYFSTGQAYLSISVSRISSNRTMSPVCLHSMFWPFRFDSIRPSQQLAEVTTGWKCMHADKFSYFHLSSYCRHTTTLREDKAHNHSNHKGQSAKYNSAHSVCWTCLLTVIVTAATTVNCALLIKRGQRRLSELVVNWW